MNYEEFKNTLLDKLNDVNKNDEYEIRIQKMLKNNGLKLDGLTISQKDSGIAPVIYLEEWYEEYLKGKSLEEIKEGILKLYEKSLSQGVIPKVPEFHWEAIKDKLYVSVVNTYANEELLEDTPHRRIEDLAIIAKIRVEEDKNETASIRVTNSLLPMLMKTKDEILNQAITNTEKMEFSCKTMYETIAGLLGNDCEMMGELFPEDNVPPIFVVTLPNAVEGAAILACRESLTKIVGTIGDDCFVIPSSIHEVLLVPKNFGMEISDLKNMVADVNRTEVKASEILSDNVYQFSGKNKKLSIAKSENESEKTNLLKRVAMSM